MTETSPQNDHTCDNNCCECDKLSSCDRANIEQLNFGFDFDANDIDWDNIPEVDVAPEVSTERYSDKPTDISDKPYIEIEIEERKDALKNNESLRHINEFMTNYSSKLLIYSMMAILTLYLIDLLLSVFKADNSKFADPLFTLLQMIITTVIGYLIGTNQNKG